VKEGKPYFSYEIEYIAPETTPPTHIVEDLIANTQAGSAYMAIAEAPEQRWEEDWPTLEPILQTIQLNPSE